MVSLNCPMVSTKLTPVSTNLAIYQKIEWNLRDDVITDQNSGGKLYIHIFLLIFFCVNIDFDNSDITNIISISTDYYY